MTAPAAPAPTGVGIGLGARPGGDTGPRAARGGGAWGNRRWRRVPVDGNRKVLTSAIRRMAVPASERASRRMVMFGLIVTFLFVLGGRGFSYIGVPPVLYLGEISILAMVIYRPTRAYLMGLLWQVGRAGRMHLLAVAMVVFFGYGVIETVRGIGQGGVPVLALLKSLQLYYYPVLLTFGMWMGSRDPKIFEKLVWALAWGNATYGVLYSAVLNKVPISVPGNAGVPLFDLGLTNAAIAILGLVAFPRKSKWTVPLVLLNVAVLFGHQIRAEWVAALVALAIYLVLTRKARRLMAGLGLIVAVATVVTIINVQIPGPADRGGAVRPTDVIGRALGAFDPQLAAKFTNVQRVQGAAGTAQFRQDWWKGIWKSATSDPTYLFFGHSYGFNLQTLAPPGRVDPTVRSPHNIIFYSIGYTGLLGVALMALLYFAMGRQLWVVYRRTGNPVGLCVLVLMVTASQFEPFLESPFGAAACYLTVGMCMAPLLQLGRKQGRVLPKRIEHALAANRVTYDPRPAPVPAQLRVASRAGLGGKPGQGVGPGSVPAPSKAARPLRRPAALSAGAGRR
jgi:hypothetical protein